MESHTTRLRRVSPAGGRSVAVARRRDAWRPRTGAPDLPTATLGPARPDVRLAAGAAAHGEADVTGPILDEARCRLDAAGRKETG